MTLKQQDADPSPPKKKRGRPPKVRQPLNQDQAARISSENDPEKKQQDDLEALKDWEDGNSETSSCKKSPAIQAETADKSSLKDTGKKATRSSKTEATKPKDGNSSVSSANDDASTRTAAGKSTSSTKTVRWRVEAVGTILASRPDPEQEAARSSKKRSWNDDNNDTSSILTAAPSNAGGKKKKKKSSSPESLPPAQIGSMSSGSQAKPPPMVRPPSRGKTLSLLRGMSNQRNRQPPDYYHPMPGIRIPHQGAARRNYSQPATPNISHQNPGGSNRRIPRIPPQSQGSPGRPPEPSIPVAAPNVGHQNPSGNHHPMPVIPPHPQVAPGTSPKPNILQDFICLISHQIPLDPVFAEDGQLYERKCILQRLNQSNLSPATNQVIGRTLITPSVIKNTIQYLVQQVQNDQNASAQDKDLVATFTARVAEQKAKEALIKAAEDGDVHRCYGKDRRELLLWKMRFRERQRTFVLLEQEGCRPRKYLCYGMGWCRALGQTKSIIPRHTTWNISFDNGCQRKWFRLRLHQTRNNLCVW